MEELYQHSRTLTTEIGRWLQQSSLMDGPCANHGGEDEANYSLTFFPYYLLTGDGAMLDRCRSLLAPSNQSRLGGKLQGAVLVGGLAADRSGLPGPHNRRRI